MTNLQLTHMPIAKAEMLIRKPVADVFTAFIDPAVTTRFWFTNSSGPLEPDAQVQWTWELYDAAAQVTVKALEANKRILIAWGDDSGSTTVEWNFTPRADGTTLVSITEAGFAGAGDAVVQQAIGSTEAFTMVLAGLKALLEHNVTLNLIADRFPDGLAPTNA